MQALTVFLQYTLPGLPSICAGDEAGSMGYKDPMNRKPFPWNNIDERFLEIYKHMGELRNRYHKTFASTNFSIIQVDEKKLVYKRDNLIFVINRTSKNLFIGEYNIKNASFALKNVEEEHVLCAYNAVVIEM